MSKHKSMHATADKPEYFTSEESPFALDAAPAQHTYGAASLQVYANGQVAYNTHASADGFLAYVNQFEQTSFRVRDTNVQWWQYDPPYDDWQDKYGCDSIKVFYHAGHGGTDASTGNYTAPLGAVWSNVDHLNSSQMSIGDQRLRYIFLATCEGCMVFAPNNPIRTWNGCNRGFRMLFGATGDIYDNPDYGKNFWNHWKSGDSFSQAWQDSLLDAGSSQQPSSTAVGASAAEAKDRLFNERFFTNATPSREWYWWRWVGNAPSAAKAQVAAFPPVPEEVKFARVAPPALSRESVLARMKRLGFDALTALPEGRLDSLRVTQGTARFGVLPNGAVVDYAPVELARSSLGEGEVLKAARLALGDMSNLGLMSVLPVLHAGARSDGGSGQEPEVFEHIAVYRQQLAGLPVLTPGVGEVRVHIGASGQVRRILDSRLDILSIEDTGPFPLNAPRPAKGHAKPKTESVFAALEAASAAFPGGDRTTSSRLLPGSIEFGYSLRGTDLVPVARGKVEISKGPYRMYEAVEVDLALH